MTRYIKKSSHKLGQRPGEITYIGRERTSPVTIDVIDFTKDTLTEVSIDTIDSLAHYKNDNTTTWINFTGVHDAAMIDKIGQLFDIHPLVLEDIANTGLRPKIEDRFAELVQ